ncbi:MAG: class II fructose-1,6-bisphosphate aldolase [Bacillota bacterium]|nr:class II fructose-1,6-bisphosphate aldolase [Bacillota bacterium]
MLVSAAEMLKKAKAGHYAVGHFNTNNLEWTKAILTTAEELKSPVIISVSMGAGKYMGGYTVVAALVKSMHDSLKISVPVALHLDHGNYDAALACIDAGFTSVMFDGSSLPLEENVEKTKTIVKLAHSKGISVEAEVGAIGGTEDGITADGEVADPKDCALMASLGIDFLAAGIGNIHGIYPADWTGLHIDVLNDINAATNNIPLVLHGGTGIPDDQIRAAIKNGVSKINVNTDCQLVFAEATIAYCAAGKADPSGDNKEKGYDPRKLLKPGYEAIKAKVKEKMELFGSVGKAA